MLFTFSLKTALFITFIYKLTSYKISNAYKKVPNGTLQVPKVHYRYVMYMYFILGLKNCNGNFSAYDKSHYGSILALSSVEGDYNYSEAVTVAGSLNLNWWLCSGLLWLGEGVLEGCSLKRDRISVYSWATCSQLLNHSFCFLKI